MMDSDLRKAVKGLKARLETVNRKIDIAVAHEVVRKIQICKRRKERFKG